MLVVTCALIQQAGNVLITQRSEKMSLAYLWEFPGGKQEKGESLEECIHREIREELLVDIKILQALEGCPHSYPGKELILYPFVAEITQGIPSLTEHINLAWVDEQSVGDYPLAPADLKVWIRYRNYLNSMPNQ